MHLARAVLFLCCAAPACAADLVLNVRETAGVARSGELVRSGVPLPRASAITTTDRLGIADDAGHAVPAQFRILGRWNDGLAANAPIQWLLVSFPATVGAKATARYHLVTDAPNPAPAAPLRLTRDGGRVTVDTGAATFVIGGTALFDEVRAGGAVRISGGALTAQIDGHDTALASIRSVTVEESGPLAAAVIVDGAYDLAPVGGGGIGSHRRYRFAAGSPTAIVEQSVTWEGDRCGTRGAIDCNGVRNAVLVTRVRDALVSSGGVTAAIERTQRYQPQAVSANAIDIAGNKVWLGTRQGLFATIAVSVSPGEDVTALLEHPLRAWPDASAFAAVEDIPAGPLPAQLADYDRAVRGVLARTQEKSGALDGLMTFGLYPRLWGTPIYSDEVTCGGPPSWDETYWCSTWTDYHNAAATAALWAMRSGEVEWLDELARPAALRMLYTQIYQCSPSDPFFYCGQAPAGYGGYRADFNSSHAYFDNLQLYYWLSGDSTVVDTLKRGAASMREYLCSRRPAAACNAGDPPTDEYANLTGRVASQWFSVFRFVGMTGGDASYLDDWRANLGRAVTQQFLLLDDRYGFVFDDWRPVPRAGGTHATDQLWMTALYDMKNLERLRRDTGDAPLGEPPLRPSEIIAAYARTLERYARGAWPNQLDVTWSGGTIVSVRANGGGSDPFLYDTGRAALSGPVAEAAAFTGDAALRALAVSLTVDAIGNSIADGGPLGKIQGEFLARLHGAVAALAAPPPRRRAAKP
jgi:hypothetical protein